MAYAKIRPRRGTASEWATANPVLAEGEIGIEVPDGGVGTGLVKIKFGDGVTAWNNLPYGVTTSDFAIDNYIVQNLETEATDKVPSVSAVRAGFDEINNNLDDRTQFPDGNVFYPDYQDGKYGFNTNPNRGADTFFPFKSADAKTGRFHKASASSTVSVSYEKNQDTVSVISNSGTGTCAIYGLTDVSQNYSNGVLLGDFKVGSTYDISAYTHFALVSANGTNPPNVIFEY